MQRTASGFSNVADLAGECVSGNPTLSAAKAVDIMFKGLQMHLIRISFGETK